MIGVTLRWVGQCLLTISMLCSTAVDAEESAETSPLTNVILILADDLGWGEVGCFGQEKIPTPNIDRLATEGIRFTRHYSGAPVCAPSRCVLMTGRHLGHAEIRGNLQASKLDPQFTEGQHPISREVRTLAQAFRDAGYRTGAMGKWGLGPVGSTGDPNAKGFDLFFGYNCQAVAHSYFPAHLWRNNQRITINQKPIPGHKKQPNGEVLMSDWLGETYAPKLMISEAENFIVDNQDKPFFLYLPFIEPHVAMHPPRESVEKFPDQWDDQVYRGEAGYLPHPRPHAGYAAMISDLDGYVGRVLRKLDELKLSERTLVIFTSDNGTTHEGPRTSKFHVGGADAAFFNSTAGLKGFKGSVYEGGLRVPLVARLPSVIPAGIVSDQPSYFADWFPTLCDAVGIEGPEVMDGNSIWLQLTGHPTEPREKPMVWVFPEYGGQVAVRIGDMKAIKRDLKKRNPGDWEVYDLATDPNERKNLAAQRADVVAAATEILRRETDENLLFPVPFESL